MNTLHLGDALEVLKTMPDQSVHCCVTSPPYWGLRDYGVEGQLGLEQTPQEFVAKMSAVFEEVRRVLRDDGTLWLNIGDSYAGSNKGSKNTKPEFAKQASNKGARAPVMPVPDSLKPKDLVGIPWRLAFALQDSGWYLRQDIIWHKPNPMPESVTDRCTKSHEHVFLLSKSAKYHFDHEAIKEPAVLGWNGSDFESEARRTQYGNNKPRKSVKRGGFNGITNDLKGRESFRAIRDMRHKRDVWTITTEPSKIKHYAMMPKALAKNCILAGCPEGGVVLDPFAGTGTVGIVANEMLCRFVGIELNPETHAIAGGRLKGQSRRKQIFTNSTEQGDTYA